MKKIIVTDFTLKSISADKDRQLTFRDKTNIAKILDLIGADAIELPMVKNAKEDNIVNRTIASLIKNSTVKIPSGITTQSIDLAWDCISEANDKAIRITVPVSTVQMEYMYHLKAPKMLEMIAEAIKYALTKCQKVELVCVDASRAEREFLKSVAIKACESGAFSITLCDDAGVMMPKDFEKMVKDIKSSCDIKVGVMPSDAISMAAANAIAAISAGADSIEAVCDDKSEWFNIAKLSDIISKKGIDLDIGCGLNAAGIHRDIYELNAHIEHVSQAVSVVSENAYQSVKLTADSTLFDVCEAVRALGYELTHEDSGKVFDEFKRVSQKKNRIGFKEIDAIVASVAMQVPSTYHVESFVINSGNIINATANVVLTRDGERLTGISVGDGPINAAFLAIEQVIGHHYELDDFQIQSITEGHEAMGSALVKLRDGDKLYSGVGVSTDIIGASIRAYINALNKIVYNAK